MTNSRGAAEPWGSDHLITRGYGDNVGLLIRLGWVTLDTGPVPWSARKSRIGRDERRVQRLSKCDVGGIEDRQVLP